MATVGVCKLLLPVRACDLLLAFPIGKAQSWILHQSKSLLIWVAAFFPPPGNVSKHNDNMYFLIC